MVTCQSEYTTDVSEEMEATVTNLWLPNDYQP